MVRIFLVPRRSGGQNRSGSLCVVGTVPGLVWLRFGPNSGSRSKLSGRMLKFFGAFLAQPVFWSLDVPEAALSEWTPTKPVSDVCEAPCARDATHEPNKKLTRKSVVRAGFGPDSSREGFEIGPDQP